MHAGCSLWALLWVGRSHDPFGVRNAKVKAIFRQHCGMALQCLAWWQCWLKNALIALAPVVLCCPVCCVFTSTPIQAMQWRKPFFHCVLNTGWISLYNSEWGSVSSYLDNWWGSLQCAVKEGETGSAKLQLVLFLKATCPGAMLAALHLL